MRTQLCKSYGSQFCNNSWCYKTR